jgi:D-inositol-3-phosphate glycosyltransferase
LGLAAHLRVLTDPASFMPWKEQLYAAADVFVSPIDNIQETFGLTPLEAMACGIPQIVSNWDGYRDTVVDGETGFLVPTYWTQCQGDVDALAHLTESPWDHLALAQSVVVDMRIFNQCVQRLMDSPELARQMSIASRERAAANFSWQVVLERQENLWSELAEEARRSPETQYDFARYALPEYGASFGHFASETLGPEVVVRLSALGQALAMGQATLPMHYSDQWKYLEGQLLQRIMGGLVHAHGKGAGLSLQRMVEVIGKGNPALRPTVLRHALFLMKYGFIEIAENGFGLAPRA